MTAIRIAIDSAAAARAPTGACCTASHAPSDR